MAATRRRRKAEPAEEDHNSITAESEEGASQDPAIEDGEGEEQGRFTRIPPGADFWVWMTRFTTDDWNNLIAYLWRTAPKWDARFNGRATAIRKYAEPFDLERIKQDEGSGGYRVDFVTYQSATRKARRLAQTYFEIVDPKFPPRLPYGDWVKDPVNANWIWEHQGKDAADGTAAPGDNRAATLRDIAEVVRTIRPDSDSPKVAEQLLTMVKDNAAELKALSDPNRQFDLIARLIKLMPQPAAAPSLTESPLLQMLMEDRREMRAELAALRQQQQKAPSLMEQLREMREVQELLRGPARERRNAADDWGNIISSGLEHLAPLINGAGAYLSRQAQPQQQQPRIVVQPQAQQPQQEQQQRPEQPPMNNNPLAQHEQTLTQAAPFMLDMFAAGQPGYDFRDWFISRFGLYEYTQLRSAISPEGLAQEVCNHPMLSIRMRPPERVVDWMREVFTPLEDGPAVDIDPMQASPERDS